VKARRFAIAALMGLACAWSPVRAAERASVAQPLAIGDTFTLDSKALGETRRINVWRPPAEVAESGAAKPGAPLPVLYLLDGGLGEDFLHVAA
jgi:enterochelin esterase-like enzyme